MKMATVGGRAVGVALIAITGILPCAPDRRQPSGSGPDMLPVGEMMLIYVSLGKSLNLLRDKLYAFVIIVMMVTTLLTLPFLKLALERQQQGIPVYAMHPQSDA